MLLADPAATLAAEGVGVPEGVTVNVAVDAEDVRTLVIPLPPTGALSDRELSAVAASGVHCAWTDTTSIPRPDRVFDLPSPEEGAPLDG